MRAGENVAMDLLSDLHVRYEVDVPLAGLTWYGVGGKAGVVAHPSSVQQLSALASRCHEAGVRVYVLGSGANLLVSDEGVPVEKGIVIKLDEAFFKRVDFGDGEPVGGVGAKPQAGEDPEGLGKRSEGGGGGGNVGGGVMVGAGFDLMKLVLETAKRGLEGLQHMAGIPASVGGAVRMNAGGAFGEIGTAVKRVQVMDDRGHVYYRDRDDLVFSYRHTNIVARYILSVEFELYPDDADALMKRVREVFMYKKNSQPMGENSAGCAFKNPGQSMTTVKGAEAGGAERTDDREEEGDGEDDDGRAGASGAMPAGKLIDEAGLKGYRVGGAEVSKLHANFIYTHPGCKASDVLAVMTHVQETVLAKTGIALEREVVVWP